jgi:YD repeat-containing protein
MQSNTTPDDGADPAPTNNISWAYDAMYRLTNETYDASGSISTNYYWYDTVGNRYQKRIQGCCEVWYYYDNNQVNGNVPLTSVSGHPSENPNYQYDANGSVTNKTAGAMTYDFTYDVQNRLSEAIVFDSSTWTTSTNSFLYDYQGIRVRVSTDGVEKRFLIDPHNPTGYAQVLGERTTQMAPELANACNTNHRK